ncbi:probable glucan 1,3-beta-glucosidase A [Corylus avellana]|uniref:probable glucan 1,3-beta-glucosidase A n=1 Tax=Corylus avellana TaxID=13451 RepID=UPI00286BE88A|nr:probable glucan 1,3-beta-glucosidase A [Corylus avellana]
MASCFYLNLYLVFFLSCVLSPSLAQTANSNLPFKAVNLGDWLLIEGWMKPSLFDGITNKDLLDGTQVQFMSTNLQKYLSAENGGGANVVSNRPSASGWETFRLWRVSDSSFNFRVFNKQFVGLASQGTEARADSNAPGNSETFEIIRNDDDPNRVRIKATNGLFLQAQSETLVTADYGGSGWEDSNPSVFKMTIVKTLQGEYQITNGYGPDRAPQVMRDHWNTYITDEDFRFMSSNGLNAVRIPVGWWIAQDPTPPKPFVGGSLQALDNAFTWAQKYGMKVIVDLHAVQGSQNGNDHSGARDGYQEWGASNIQDTVAVIDFLAQRYANNPSLAAIELMNEPVAPGVTLDDLKNYYQAGYDAVRKYTSSAYVILSNRLGEADPKELLSFAGNLNLAVIDVHYYNLFSDMFNNMDVQQNIDYINNQRASDLQTVTTSNGPLTFVGEWTAEFAKGGASMEDYQRFANAQIQVYGRATFGWAYWAYKCGAQHWSLKWMIENNYIKL